MHDYQALALARQALYAEPVRSRKALAKYTGFAAFPEPLRTWKKHCPNIPRVCDEVRLCAETADYLYSKYTPTAVSYRKGSRPVLEGLIDEIVLRDKPRPAARELAFAVWNWIFENVCLRLGTVGNQVYHTRFHYFGTDEDVASLRCRADCYCSSRLFATMMQVAGVPSRLIHLMGNNINPMHSTVEIYLEGRWCFFDMNCHDYAINSQGLQATTWDLMTDSYCQGQGLREDKRVQTPILDPGYFENVSIVNYPLALSTKHYQLPTGDLWWSDDEVGARRTARFGF